MKCILEKLCLGSLTQQFSNQKVTPDIVCMLSLCEFHQLGVNTSSEIMALRMECTRYGCVKPVKKRIHGEYAKFEIPKEILENFLDEDFLVSEIATMLSVSESTIYGRMRSYGLSKLDFSEITDQQLDTKVSKIVQDFPFCGENMIKQLLLGKGIKVQRSRMRDSIHRVDSQGVAGRRKNRLQRRVYNVKGPNHLWHVDTNHKSLVNTQFFFFCILKRPFTSKLKKMKPLIDHN